MLSTAGGVGGADNKNFEEVRINGGTISTGELKLSSIGRLSQTQLKNVFPSDFVVDTNARFTIASNVNVELKHDRDLTINGFAKFESGSKFTMENLNSNFSHQFVPLVGTLEVQSAEITGSGVSPISVLTGGKLIAQNSKFDNSVIAVADGAAITPAIGRRTSSIFQSQFQRG